MSLYRPEAIEAQRRRLYGAVTIHQPASLMVMTGIAILVMILTGVFLLTGSITRKETVLGWVVPESGLSQVYGPKSGVARQVLVKVGDLVAADQSLAVLSVDVSTGQGDLAPQQRAMIQERIVELENQIADDALKQSEDLARLKAHAQALRSEAVRLGAERALVERQYAIARRQLAAAAPLVAQGYMSILEKERREQAAVSIEQDLTDIQRQVDAKNADAHDADAQIKSLPTSTELQVSQLRAQRSALEQSLAELAAQDRLILKAPVAGRVAAINLRAGDTALSDAPLFEIAPTGSPLVAELLAPTKAAGFIAAGQQVRLMVDAFPSERFGEVEASISTVSRAPVIPAQVGIPLDVKGPVYRLTARLASNNVEAYGKSQPLQPGMTVKASIVTARRTFLQWLFDPLLAAGRNVG